MLKKLKLPTRWTPVEEKLTENRANSPASLEFATAALTFIVSTSLCANIKIFLAFFYGLINILEGAYLMVQQRRINDTVYVINYLIMQSS